MHHRKNTVTAVPNSSTLIHEVDVLAGMKLLSIAIFVANGGAAINDLEIRGVINQREVVLISTTAEFTAAAPKAPLLGASGDLNAIAANASGWALISCAAYSKIRVYATCASAGPTNITVDSESDDLG